jgi:hypothetical protein
VVVSVKTQKEKGENMSGIIDTIKSAGNALLDTAAGQINELESKARAMRDMAAKMLQDRARFQAMLPRLAQKDPKAADAIKAHLSAGNALQARVTDILKKIDAALASLKQNAGLAELGGYVIPALLFAAIGAVYYALYSYNKKSDVLLQTGEAVEKTGGTPEQKAALYRAAHGLPVESAFSFSSVPLWMWGAGAAIIAGYMFMRRGKHE